jgi:hypothetical protein
MWSRLVRAYRVRQEGRCLARVSDHLLTDVGLKDVGPVRPELAHAVRYDPFIM